MRVGPDVFYDLLLLRCVVETLCLLFTGVFSMPLGILQFIPVYHTLHDNYNIHTEVCVFLLIMIYTLVIWSADRNPGPDARTAVNSGRGKAGCKQWNILPLSLGRSSEHYFAQKAYFLCVFNPNLIRCADFNVNYH